MAMVRLEQIGERIGEIDALPGPEAKESCAALEKEISEALRVASGRERTVLETLRHKLAELALNSEVREVDFAMEMTAEKSVRLAEMQEDLEGLHECLRDVGTLVQQQGSDLGVAEEEGFGQAQAATYGAAKEAAKAGKSRAKRRVVEGGAVTAAVGAAIGIIGGPIGMGLGAAAGAGLGSFVGNRWGKSETKRIDREFASLKGGAP